MHFQESLLPVFFSGYNLTGKLLDLSCVLRGWEKKHIWIHRVWEKMNWHLYYTIYKVNTQKAFGGSIKVPLPVKPARACLLEPERRKPPLLQINIKQVDQWLKKTQKTQKTSVARAANIQAQRLDRVCVHYEQGITEFPQVFHEVKFTIQTDTQVMQVTLI